MLHLSKMHLAALSDISRDGVTRAEAALVEHLLAHGLIAPDLLGFVLTERGIEACKLADAEHARLQEAMRDTPFNRWLRGE